MGIGDWGLGIGDGEKLKNDELKNIITEEIFKWLIALNDKFRSKLLYFGNLKSISLYLYFQISRLKYKYNKIKINQWEIKMIHL